jgi:hypothetical protein
MVTKKITSILDFKPRVEDYTITNPSTGEELTLSLKPLTPRQLSTINSQIKRPKPKEKGFKGKDEFGRPIPIFDEDDPQYILELSRANQDFVYAWLIASWDGEIPGETPQDKMETLRDNIPNWVFLELQRTLQEIQGYRESDVVIAKKKLAQALPVTSNTNSAKNGDDG